MAESHQRRIIRRAALALAVAVLLPVWYLGSWLVMHVLHGRGMINLPTVDTLDSTLFAPVALYCRSELPGADIVSGAGVWCEVSGASTFTVIDVDIEFSAGPGGDQSDLPLEQDQAAP